MSNDLLQYAQELTRSSYSNKQAKIIEWFTKNYAEYVDTTSKPLVLRLEVIPPTIIVALLASFVVKNRLANMEARRRIHRHTCMDIVLHL